MNGTSIIIKGDNAKVHAWFTEHDRLYECHCDECSAERTRLYCIRVKKNVRDEKIYNATGFIACFVIPLTVIAWLTTLVTGSYVWSGALFIALLLESAATSIICHKMNPYK